MSYDQPQPKYSLQRPIFLLLPSYFIYILDRTDLSKFNEATVK